MQDFYVLMADNFTPLERTPWAGKELSRGFKNKVCGKVMEIGESWEFSCDPSFPSRIKNTGQNLIDIIDSHPDHCLGTTISDSDSVTSCEILLKLINANTPLSVQVHPTDDDKNLKSIECGKPESWLILSADKGAGIYLGFSKKTSKDEIYNAFKSGDDHSDLLNFIPVEKGDYFEIDPGLVHAIAPGTVILEPQRILQGKSGKTYRLWDWGRKFDSNGKLDMEKGKYRELHLDQAIDIIDPDAQCGDQFLRNVKVLPNKEKKHFGMLLTYPKNQYYQVICLDITRPEPFNLNFSGGYAVLLNEVEELKLKSENTFESIIKGECVFITANKNVSIQPKSNGMIYLTIPHYTNFSLS